MYHTNNLRSGLKILYEKQPYIIEIIDFVKPGKGQSFSRVKMRNLINNKLIEKTFRSTEKFKKANIIQSSARYLYNDTKFWYFLNLNSFDEFSVEKKILKDSIYWLIKQKKYKIILWNYLIISVIPKNFVYLTVVSSEPGIKKDFSSNNLKLVKLNTGIFIKVPYFIKNGDIIKVDTRTKEYVCRK